MPAPFFVPVSRRPMGGAGRASSERGPATSTREMRVSSRPPASSPPDQAPDRK